MPVRRGESLPLHLHPGAVGFLDRFETAIADPDGGHWRTARQKRAGAHDD